MSMSKKDFIALANEIRAHNRIAKCSGEPNFHEGHLDTLAAFCQRQNPNFKRDRWLSYIAGECGPNGGSR